MSEHDPYAPKDPAIFVNRFETGDAVQPSDGALVSAPQPPSLPQGTSAEVLAWVGEDTDRAQQALDAENDSHKPRKGLIEELKEILS